MRDYTLTLLQHEEFENLRHSHEEEIPTIIIHIDETGRLNEPHEKCLQALMVLSEPWT